MSINLKDLQISLSANQPADAETKKSKLAAKIISALKAKDISYSRFAEKLGKRPSEITKWLSGKHNFTIDSLFRIEELLKITLVSTEPELKLKGGPTITVPGKTFGHLLDKSTEEVLKFKALTGRKPKRIVRAVRIPMIHNDDE